MLARFEAARRLYNAVLGEALATLQRMRESKQWQAARAMPKGKPDSPERKARGAAFNACIERFGFTAYQFGSLAVAHKNAAGLSGRLGSRGFLSTKLTEKGERITVYRPPSKKTMPNWWPDAPVGSEAGRESYGEIEHKRLR